MRPDQPTRSSGASLAIVALAIGATALIGYFAKNGARLDRDRFAVPPGYANIALRVVDGGIGTADVPTAPPSAGWLKLELLQDGQPVHFRPIQFRRSARDANGRPVVVEHRWSSGYYYLFARTGFPKRTGPVTVELTYRGRPISVVQIPQLTPPRPQPLIARPTLSGARTTLFRLKGPDVEEDELGIQVDEPLAKDEILVVERIGSTYQNPEPYGVPEIVKSGNGGSARVMRLALGYPSETPAVQLAVRRYRPRRVQRELRFPVNYAGISEVSRYYSTRESVAPLAPGIQLYFARSERSYRTDRATASPLALTLLSRASLAWARARLRSPGYVYESRLRILNALIRRPRLADYPILQSTGLIEPELLSSFDVTIDADIGVYDLISEEMIVVPIAFKEIKRWYSNPDTQPFHVRDEPLR